MTLLELTEEMKQPLQAMHNNLKLFLKAVFPAKKGKELEYLTQDLIQTFYVQAGLLKIVIDGKDKGLSFKETAQSVIDEKERNFLTMLAQIAEDFEKYKGGDTE